MVPDSDLTHRINHTSDFEVFMSIKNGIEEIDLPRITASTFRDWFLKWGVLTVMAGFFMGCTAMAFYSPQVVGIFSLWEATLLALIPYVIGSLFLIGRHFKNGSKKYDVVLILSTFIFATSLALSAFLGSDEPKSVLLAMVVLSFIFFLGLWFYAVYIDPSASKVLNQLRNVEKNMSDLKRSIARFGDTKQLEIFEKIISKELTKSSIVSPIKNEGSEEDVAKKIEKIVEMQQALHRLELLALADSHLKFSFEPMHIEPTVRMFAKMKDSPSVLLLGNLGYLSSQAGARELINLITKSSTEKSITIFIGVEFKKFNHKLVRVNDKFEELIDNLEKEIPNDKDAITNIGNYLKFHVVDECRFNGFGNIILADNEKGGEVIKRAYTFVPIHQTYSGSEQSPWKSQPLVLCWSHGKFKNLENYIRLVRKDNFTMRINNSQSVEPDVHFKKMIDKKLTNLQ